MHRSEALRLLGLSPPFTLEELDQAFFSKQEKLPSDSHDDCKKAYQLLKQDFTPESVTDGYLSMKKVPQETELYRHFLQLSKFAEVISSSEQTISREKALKLLRLEESFTPVELEQAYKTGSQFIQEEFRDELKAAYDMLKGETKKETLPSPRPMVVEGPIRVSNSDSEVTPSKVLHSEDDTHLDHDLPGELEDVPKGISDQIQTEQKPKKSRIGLILPIVFLTIVIALIGLYLYGSYLLEAEKMAQTSEKERLSEPVSRPPVSNTHMGTIEDKERKLQAAEEANAKRKRKLSEAKLEESSLPRSVTGEDLVALGREQWELQECYRCHQLNGEGGKTGRPPGPALDNIGNLMTPVQLKEKLLLSKNREIEKFEKQFEKSFAHQKYKDLMFEDEMDALVAYLSTLKALLESTSPKLVGKPKLQNLEAKMPKNVIRFKDMFTPNVPSPSSLVQQPAPTSQQAVTLIEAGKSFYYGQVVNGKKQGQGIYTLADGTKYEGEWQDNKKHGSGMLTLPDGEKYVGQWQADKRHGQGKGTWPNGSQYEGGWRDNKAHGQGIFTQVNGVKYEAEWEDGKVIESSRKFLVVAP